MQKRKVTLIFKKAVQDRPYHLSLYLLCRYTDQRKIQLITWWHQQNVDSKVLDYPELKPGQWHDQL